MHILLPSDVFPPGSVGGAAWSTYTLARALLDQGHTVTAVVPVQGQRGTHHSDVSGVPTLRHGYVAPRLPFVQNYFRHERLWPALAALLIDQARAAVPPLVIHAQHVQSVPPAVLAGQRLGLPVVATVRDHWPWDYFATGLHGNCVPYERSTWASLATDLPARLGPLPGILALVAMPYMLAHLRRRAAFLARADAVIAVSHYVARRLAAIVPPERLHVIPNMVDRGWIEQIAATPPQTDLPGPFLLFVGKLERNKGADRLGEIIRYLVQSGISRPDLAGHTLVIAGSGSLKAGLEHGLAALGVPVRFLDWVSHDEVVRLMARCDLLLFPSAWGEPLSRVLLEAAMLGVPMLAMPTGGTPDIIVDGESGMLARTPAQFAYCLAYLLHHPSVRQRLGAQARQTAQCRFAVEVVLPQVVAVYESAKRKA